MEDALKKLKEKLDSSLNEALYDAYTSETKEKEGLSIKVPMSEFLNFLRYNLLVSKDCTDQEKKQRWETFLAGVKTETGEIPLVVMYKGFAVYTDTMKAVREENSGKTMRFYTKSQIATIA